MSMSELLERITGQQRQRRKQRIESYRGLVAAIAIGNEPAADTVEAALASTDKSLDELRHDVELYQRRMALKALVNSLPGLEAEQQHLRNQIAKADEVLADAEQQHHETTWPIRGRLDEIKAAISDAQAAKNDLFHSCEDAELRRQLDENAAEARTLSERRTDLSRHAEQLESQVRVAKSAISHQHSEGEIEHQREKAAEFKKQADDARRRLQAVDKEAAAVTKRREEIEQQMRQA